MVGPLFSYPYLPRRDHMQDNRPAVYLEEGAVIYRASAIGHCLRMLWAARSNMPARPFPKVIQAAMDKGTEMEAHILNVLYEDFNFTYGYQGQQFQVELPLGTFNGYRILVRGAVDEIGHPVDRPPARPIDVKHFGQSLVDEYRTKGILGIPRYAWQQSAYAHGFNSPEFYMPIYNKDTAKIEPWSVNPIPAPYTIEQIRDRVMTVEEAFQDNEMPAECPAEYGCQYYYLHDEKTVGDLPEDARVLLIARINLDKKLAIFSGAREKLNEAIREKLPQDVAFHLTMDDGTYSVTVIANPDKFNTKAAKEVLTAAQVDWQNDPEFIVPGVGTQLRVTKPKGKGGSGG